MISVNETNQMQCDARLRLKTHDQTLIRQAIVGAGLTPWEAQVLPQVVEEIYFRDGGSRPWKDGQVRFPCVAATVGAGKPLSEAYHAALLFTGKVVMLTGVTLSIGVITWVASPIKFQADMGLLLAFMFLWNMLGALVLLPALAHFLLKPGAVVPEAMAEPRVAPALPQPTPDTP